MDRSFSSHRSFSFSFISFLQKLWVKRWATNHASELDQEFHDLLENPLSIPHVWRSPAIEVVKVLLHWYGSILNNNLHACITDHDGVRSVKSAKDVCYCWWCASHTDALREIKRSQKKCQPYQWPTIEWPNPYNDLYWLAVVGYCSLPSTMFVRLVPMKQTNYKQTG